MKPFTQRLPPTFYINMTNATERRTHMETQLQSLGIPYARFEASVGKDIWQDPKIYDDVAAKKLQGSLTPGHVGCSYSHIRLYKKIIDEQIPWTLILEDDVRLPSDMKTILETIDTGNAEYISFNYSRVGWPYFQNWIKVVLRQLRQTTSLRTWIYPLLKAPLVAAIACFEGLREACYRHFGKRSIGQFPRPLYLAGAYLVSLSGAQKLYAVGLPIRMIADRLPNQTRFKAGLRMYGYIPLLVHQDSFFESTTKA